MMEIRDHALIYALLSKKILESCDADTAERLIREITVSYGQKRGRRMRAKADENGEKADLNTYLIHGEWEGKEGENISAMEYGNDRTVSSVTKCAWYDTWKQYGLLPYGSYYCHYIDEALCAGFGGSFSLNVSSSLSRGDSSCCFIWSRHADEEYVSKMKKQWKERYILPFDFHVSELLECAGQVLGQYSMENVIHEALAEYKKLA